MSNQTGSFIYLQAKKLVDPEDTEEYDNTQTNVLAKSALVQIFTLYWARLYEMGKYKYMIPNRLIYYVVVAGLPSMLHAVYATSEINRKLSVLDGKYYEQYRELTK